MEEESRVDTLVKVYIKIRDDLTEKRRAFDEYEKDLKRQLELIEFEIKKICDETGVDSFKTVYGTAYKTTKDFVAVREWDKTVEFIFSNDMRQLLNKSVSKTAVKEFMAENNNQLPPGLEYGQTVEIQIRKGEKK